MKKTHKFLKELKSSKTVFALTGFLLGRVIFFGSFNPFATAYVTAFFARREFYPIVVMTALGLLSVANEINVFRYIFALIMIGLFNYCTDRENLTRIKIAALSALSVFAGGIVYTLFSNMAPYYTIMTFMETGLNVVLFLIIKGNVGIFNVLDTNVVQAQGYSDHIRLVIADRLKKASDIFSNISHTYSSSLLVEEVEEEQTRINIVENICTNICRNCQNYDRCWHNENTYSSLYNLTDKWLKDGCVKADKYLNTHCIKSGEVYMLSKGSVELYRLNKLWLNKTEQSKLLIGKQLDVISGLLGSLDSDVRHSFNIDKDLSNLIYKSLTGLRVNSVVALKGEKGYEVSVSIPHYYGCHNCGEELAEHIGEILGVEMIKKAYSCRGENNSCIIQFCEAPNIKVAPFITGVKRDGSEITGDCYTYMGLEEGRYLLALADGMGSGTDAREESAASIEMYEDFMVAGFNRNMALEIINSILLAGNEKESFSTLDICTIDCYTGECEFVKIGAVSAFIIREDKIDLIKSQSLPVGILGEVDTEVTDTYVEKGDIIVMVTDGILDSTGNVLRNEKWLVNLLNKNRNKSPEKIGKIILKKARENSHNVIRDDMTVLVAQIY